MGAGIRVYGAWVEVFRLEREGVEILYENDLRHKMNTWNSELDSEKKPDTEGGGGKDIPKPKKGFWLLPKPLFVTIFWK